MARELARGMCIGLGLLCGSAWGQSHSWQAMTIANADVRSGVSPDMVVIRESVGAGTSSRFPAIDSTLASVSGVVAVRGVASGSVINGARYRLVRVDSAASASELISAFETFQTVTAEPVVFGVSTTVDDLPNDPLLQNQYAIQNTGQPIDGHPGLAGADVRVAQAWDIQRGSAQVKVAVIDSGVSSTHPDLSTKLDDGINLTGGPLDDTDAPYNTHGTHIAGIVAASTNNAEGVVGVSWGSRIVPVKAANLLGFTSDVWLAEGLIWAANQGVDVAVISFGLSQPSTVLADAVAYAHDQGVVVCASTGNTGTPGVLYPAAYPEVLAVGATDNADSLAPFSTTGAEVEFVAPGVDIFSTRHTIFEPHTYGYESGTSMSTPIVAGIAALVRSASPQLTVDEIRSVLARTSRDLGGPGRDVSFGYGRVNAQRALQEALNIEWCYADVNGDGSVDPTDFSAWIALYGTGDLRGDQNRNDTIEPADFNAFIMNFVSQQGTCE